MEANKENPLWYCRYQRGPICFHNEGGETAMEYQTNIYDTFGIGKTYVDLNQSILNDLLVEVPGAIRRIPDEFIMDDNM